MKEYFFNTIQEFNDTYGFETLHPLVSVGRFDKPIKAEECMVHYGLYALFLKTRAARYPTDARPTTSTR